MQENCNPFPTPLRLTEVLDECGTDESPLRVVACTAIEAGITLRTAVKPGQQSGGSDGGGVSERRRQTEVNTPTALSQFCVLAVESDSVT